jgi:hypothetical protein
MALAGDESIAATTGENLSLWVPLMSKVQEDIVFALAIACR